MFVTILKRDRIRNDMTQAQVARRLGVSHAEYRLVEKGTLTASLDLCGKTPDPFGWPPTFVGR